MKSEVHVQGVLFSASVQGFTEMIQACNVALANGKQLLQVVQLGPTKIGAVFVRPPAKTGDSFFEEVG